MTNLIGSYVFPCHPSDAFLEVFGESFLEKLSRWECYNGTEAMGMAKAVHLAIMSSPR